MNDTTSMHADAKGIEAQQPRQIARDNPQPGRGGGSMGPERGRGGGMERGERGGRDMESRAGRGREQGTERGRMGEQGEGRQGGSRGGRGKLGWECQGMPGPDCTLAISGSEEEIMPLAERHQIKQHGQSEGDQLRQKIKGEIHPQE